jgi:hypothetical protein
MANYSKQLLSGSTNGEPIAVAATAIGSGTSLHVAVAGTSALDEVYLYVTNTDGAAHQLTLSWGVTSTGGLVSNAVTIPANSGPLPVVTGLLLQNGLAILAAADVANKLNITGFVNRIQ